MPVIFAAHGAPILLDDDAWMGELLAWAGSMPKPKSVLMVSAHWEERPAALGATRPVPLVYDFYGFPAKYHRTTYPAPGAPELAARVRELLRSRDIPCADEPERGLDHGAYVPLVAMYPAADVPVLQVSMPRLDPQELFDFGKALAPLRDEGVLLFGSGFLTHNMRYAFRPGTPSWAKDFDAWAEDALARFDGGWTGPSPGARCSSAEASRAAERLPSLPPRALVYHAEGFRYERRARSSL
jgi:4,5-DOPA dioxygenase extradiol